MLDKMKQLFELQGKVKTIKKELADSSIDVSAKDGQIKIVISGEQKIKSLEIAESLLNSQNKDTVTNDLLNCFNDAISKSQQLAADKMRQVSGLNIPGL